MEKDELIELVRKSKGGDLEAMERLLLHAHTSVSYQCRKMLPSQQDAEDMTQEILLTIYEKLDTLEEPAAFHKWLHNITARRCMNAITRTHVEYQFAEDEEGHSVLDTLEEMDEKKVPDKWLDNQETARMIDEIVNDLPEVQRLCTLMFYYSELSVKEMAHIMKVSENTIKSRLNYARKAIKEKVLDYEKKGVKLYGISPLPFLFFFLHRGKEESKNPAAAKTMVEGIVSRTSASAASTGAAASVSAGSVSTGTAASAGAASAGSAVSATAVTAASAGTAVTAAAAAATTSGGFLAAILSVIPVKVIAGVAAAAIAVGGITAATTLGNKESPETPAAVTAPAEKEETSPQNEDPQILPEETVEAFVPAVTEEIPAAAPRETTASPNSDDPADSEDNTPPETTRPTEPENNTPEPTRPTEPEDDTPEPTRPTEPDDDPEDHTHDYTRSVTREASCCMSGTAAYTCLCGDSYTEAIPKTEDHTFELQYWSSSGDYVQVCTNTGIVKQVDNDHSHHYLATVKDPDCEEGGYTVYTCKETTVSGEPCTDSFTGNETEALGHEYRSEVIAPTYTQQGYTEHTCNRCGDSYRDNYTDTTGTPLLSNSSVTPLITTDITSVVFTNTPAPEGETTDVSAAQDGSVVAWYEETTLYVSSIDGSPISAGTDCSDMFRSKSALISVDLSNLDTSNVTDMSWMFYKCSSLISLDLSSFDTGNVTDMNSMFYECSSLTSLDISSFDTGNVTDMSRMFSFCSSLSSLDVSQFDTGKVMDMFDMFWYCSSLTSLDVSNFDTGKVTNMGLMFCDCSSLTSLDVSNFDTGKVTDMGYMFDGCSGLTSLDVSNFDTGNVTDMNYMFRNCTSLTTIYAGDWTNTAVNVTESTAMFNNCVSLSGAVSYDSTRTDISMANPTTGYFTGDGESDATGDPVMNNSAVKSLLTDHTTSVVFTDLPALNGETMDVSAAQDGSVVAWQKDTTLYVASMDGSPISTGEDFSGMFQDRISLTSVDLTNLDTGNVTDMSYLFSGCSSLMSVNLGNLDTGKVTQMDFMFYECSSLSSLDLSSFDTGSVTDMSYMFAGCRSLNRLDLSSFDTGNVGSMAGMFAECGSMMSLDISSFSTGNVTDMGNMFSFCGMLKSLDLRHFDISNVRYMNSMFQDCNTLATIYAGDWTNTAVNVTDSTDMFLSCFGLNGATNYNSDSTDISMANPTTGYFTGEGSSGDHVHEDVMTVTDPTCTAAGYTTYTCSCGHTFTGDETAPLGHSYESTVVDPTETEPGYTEYTCTVCGDTYRDTGTGSEGAERCVCGAEISERACTGCWLEAGDCMCEVQQEEMPFDEMPEEEDPAEEMSEEETPAEETSEEETPVEELPEGTIPEEDPFEEEGLMDNDDDLTETT